LVLSSAALKRIPGQRPPLLRGLPLFAIMMLLPRHSARKMFVTSFAIVFGSVRSFCSREWNDTSITAPSLSFIRAKPPFPPVYALSLATLFLAFSPPEECRHSVASLWSSRTPSTFLSSRPGLVFLTRAILLLT